jgi:PAS domain S-box-containing protein
LEDVISIKIQDPGIRTIQPGAGLPPAESEVVTAQGIALSVTCGFDRSILESHHLGLSPDPLQESPVTVLNGSRDFFAATLYEAVPQAFVALDAESRFVYVNARAGAILGREPSSLLGRSVWDEFPDARERPFAQAYERARATRVPLLADGCFAPCQCECTSRLFPCDGGILIVFAEGVSGDQRKTHGVEQSRYLRAVLDTTPECIKVIRRDGVLLDMNASGLALIGAPSLDAVAGHSLYSRVVDRDREVVRHAVEAACDGERSHFEYEVEAFTGKRCRLESRIGPLRDETGIIIAALCMTRDVTQVRANEERLRESEARFRRLVERAPLGSFLNDAGGNTVYCNPRLAAIFGRPAEEIVAGKWRDAVHPADRELLMAACIAFYASDDDEMRYDYRIVRPDGVVRDVVVEQVRLRTRDGATEGFIGIIDDVTEHRMLEEQLRQSQKLEAVGRLAGGVAHDFNNLLTVIANYGQFLKQELPPGTRGRADLEELLGATRRATALTRQLLTFGRKQPTSPKLLVPNEIIRGVEDMLRRLIGEHIALVIDLEPGIGRVLVDPGQLEQILVNLAVNARDAMPTGGLLTIETTAVTLSPTDILQPDPEGAMPALIGNPGEHVVIRVTDTGLGMDDETQRRVFEPFFTTKPQGHGTGLGLATIYGIVAQAGGRLCLRSARGRGTTVEVYLPRQCVDAYDHAPSDVTHAAELRHGSETVLVAEDEAAVRESVRRILERAGYTVIEARHGADALLLWRERRDEIALVLTDLVMPEMRGSELAAALRETAPETRIVYMSGYASDSARATMSPDDVLLAKPFDADTLLRIVRDALDGVVHRT